MPGTSAPGLPRGVEHADRPEAGGGIAEQLVVVLVGGHDEHFAAGRHGGQGGDDVVGFGVGDLGPCDAAGVQGALTSPSARIGRRALSSPGRFAL